MTTLEWLLLGYVMFLQTALYVAAWECRDTPFGRGFLNGATFGLYTPHK